MEGEIRVYELAKEFGLTSKIVLNLLNKYGIIAQNHMSRISIDDCRRFRQIFIKGRRRVDELASVLGVTKPQMLDLLEAEKIDSRSYIESEAYDEVVRRFRRNSQYHELHKNTTSLKSIKIIGLFGERNYTFNFEDDVYILVAENGYGKTTILNIIMAILNGDVRQINMLPFKEVTIETQRERFSFNKCLMNSSEGFLDDLQKLLIIFSERERVKILQQYKREFVINYDLLEKMIVKKRDISKFDIERFQNKIDLLQKIQFENYKESLYKIKREFSGKILYYPTYRRIEESLGKIFCTLDFHEIEFSTSYARFGMEDVRKIVDEVLKKMYEDTSRLYGEMNSSIINDLMEGINIEEKAQNIISIDRHKIEVVIKRIGESKIKKIKNLNNIIENGLDSQKENIKFLIFYLERLSRIYDAQKSLDDKLCSFINVCNKYLINKKIEYDEVLLTVQIYNKNNEEIDFDDLSSGEKQIVSIFAKVYLDITEPNICIIDEPELSLSIEWQKDFLLDVYKSGNVGLLVTTTHSPFIFKNELRKYAKELGYFSKGENDEWRNY